MEAPCDYTFVDVGDGLSADDEAGVHEAVDAMRGLEAEEPGGADNFNFLLDFLATFLEFFPTFRETVACLARLHAYSATIICKLILARRP